MQRCGYTLLDWAYVGNGLPEEMPTVRDLDAVWDALRDRYDDWPGSASQRLKLARLAVKELQSKSNEREDVFWAMSPEDFAEKIRELE